MQNNKEHSYDGFATMGVGPCVAVAIKYNDTIALAHLDAVNLQSDEHIDNFLVQLEKEIFRTAHAKNIRDIKNQSELHIITGDVDAGKKSLYEFKNESPEFSMLADMMLLKYKSDAAKVADAFRGKGYAVSYHPFSNDNGSVDVILNKDGISVSCNNDIISADKIDASLCKKIATGEKINYHNMSKVRSQEGRCIVF